MLLSSKALPELQQTFRETLSFIIRLMIDLG
jgi:hypothetical protein